MRKWTRQPPVGTKIDWSNPLVNGLKFAVLPGQDGTLYPRDLVRGIRPTDLSGTGRVVETGSAGRLRNGRYLKTDGTGADGLDYGRTGFDEVDSTTGMTIVFRFRVFDGGATRPLLSSGENGNGFGVQLESDDVSNVLNGLRSRADNSFGTFTNFNVLPSPHEDFWHDIAFTQQGAATAADFYVNGEQVGDDGDLMTVTAHANRTTRLFALRDNNGGANTGLQYVYVFEGVLPQSAIRALHNNPWQIFKPPKQFALADVPTDVRFTRINAKPTEHEFGLAFRQTESYVTDPAYVDFGSRIYPYVDSNGIFGKVGALGNTRDRSTAFDPRLAGVHFSPNFTTPTEFRWVVKPGRYELILANGDATSGQGAQKLDFYDGIRPLFTHRVTAVTGGQFADAWGTIHTGANWPRDNKSRKVEVKSGSLRVWIGDPDAPSGNTVISYLGLRPIDGSVFIPINEDLPDLARFDKPWDKQPL